MGSRIKGNYKKLIKTGVLVLLMMLPLIGMKVNVQARIIYTTDARTNATTEKLIKKCTSENMGAQQKLKNVYYYLAKNMKYSWHTGTTKIKVSQSEINASKVLAKKLNVKYSSKFRKRYKNVGSLQGTCYGMAMVFCIAANHLGYDAYVVKGKHRNRAKGRFTEHYWACVTINGQKRYFDVQGANRAYKRGRSNEMKNFFMKSSSDKQWRKDYRW